MAITIHPRVGQILVCDFSRGFKVPEMVKSGRPVIVLSPPMPSRPNLVTVVALSTEPPDPVMDYHMILPRKALPQMGRFQKQDTWVKGDMIYSVGFHRLDLIRLGKKDPKTGKRQYFKNRLGAGQHEEGICLCLARLELCKSVQPSLRIVGEFTR